MLDSATFSILDFKFDFGLEPVLLFGLEDDLDDLLLAWLQSATCVGHAELLSQSINSSELPVGRNRANILQGQGLGELLAKKESVELDDALIHLNDRLSTQCLDAENGGVWIILEQAYDLVLE